MRRQTFIAGYRKFLSNFIAVFLLVTVGSVVGGPAGGDSVIFTIAGNGSAGFSGDNGLALQATFNSPGALAVDTAGDVYVTDLQNQRIRKISVDGIITTVAGNGQSSFGGDGGPAVAAALNLMGPAGSPYISGVAVDGAGNIYIADVGNNRVRKVINGIITTVAGNGERGSSGDGGPAVQAALAGPAAVALDASGNLFIADTGNNSVRKVTADGIISTVLTGIPDPVGIALDATGNIYVSSTANRVMKSGPSGSVEQIGTGWNVPWGLALDKDGTVYVADSHTQRVKKVGPDGSVTTVAGIGAADIFGDVQPGYSGDGGPPSNAALAGPLGVALDGAGNLYVADTGNSRIRKIAFAAPGESLVAMTSLGRSAVNLGGAFTTTFTGVNLTDATYFDVRYRAPGSTTDEVALNWQKGTAVDHTVALGMLPGDWKITGVRSHRDENDHSGSFNALSSLLTVSPSSVTSLQLDPGTVSAGNSFTARFAGSNLTTETYFDVRFQGPCGGDEIIRNWQRGLTSTYPVPAGLPPGAWTITGAWPHEDANDHSLTFFPVSAVIVVSGPVVAVALNGPITSLVIDPHNASTIYAANNIGVFKSCDAGRTWKTAAEGLPVPDTLTLAIDPVNSNVLYTGTRTAGVFKTVNAGGVWTSARSGLPAAGIRALAVNPQNSSILYAATETSGVFKSVDGGANWSPASSGLPSSTTIQSLAIDYVSPNILYAGTQVPFSGRAEVFKSIDGGDHWQSSWMPASNIQVVAINDLKIDPTNPSVIYAATDNPERFNNSDQPGVFKSVDGGTTWSGSSTGGPNHRYIASLAIDPRQPMNVYAGGIYRHSLYKSTNAGSAWAGSTILLKNNDQVMPSIRALAIDQANPSTIYAAAPEGIFKSTNSGGTWQLIGGN